jgi:hypothetical protein
VRETIWGLRPPLPAGVAQTRGEHRQHAAPRRPSLPGAPWARLWPARPTGRRPVEPLGGAIELARPYVYWRPCQGGRSPRAEGLGWRAGRRPRDGQQAAVALATAVPDATAATLLGRLRGITVRSARRPTVLQQVAEGRSGLAVAPSREAIARPVAPVAAGRLRRPGLRLGLAGASGPSRPARARGRRPGQARPRARRARWPHEGREATGVRCARREGERRVQGLRGQQVPKEPERGAAVPQGKDAGWRPEEAVRRWVVGEGAA